MQDLHHVAIIMDGNGRWASKRGLVRMAGHLEGEKAAGRIIKRALEIGLEYLTLYCLSIDNLKRPKEEVDSIFHLIETIEDDVDKNSETYRKYKDSIRILLLGRRDLIEKSALSTLDRLIEKTKENKGLTIQLAICYSGKDEINRAIRKAASSNADLSNLDDLVPFFDNPTVPSPDLIIRSGGEKRLSDFLLYQCCYSELAFYDKLWPDWDEEMLDLAINDFKSRTRRYGKVVDVKHN